MATSAPSSNTQPQRSLNRQVVLDEDEYTEALSQIIARDFYPSLVHLETTNDYLDALRSKDPQLIQASVRRMEGLSTPMSYRNRPWETPSQTPYGAGSSETPLRTPREGDEPPAKRARFDTNMSLDAFQARYTSEDNSSFTQILEDENRKRKERYSWAWEAQKRVEAQRDRMLEGRERLLIEGPVATGVRENFRIEAPKPVGLLTNEPASSDVADTGEERKGKEMVHVQTDKDVVSTERHGEEEAEEVDVMAPKKDTRSAGVDAWKFKVSKPYFLVVLRPHLSICRRETHSCSLPTRTSLPIAHQLVRRRNPRVSRRSSSMGILVSQSKTTRRLDLCPSPLALPKVA